MKKRDVLTTRTVAHDSTWKTNSFKAVHSSTAPTTLQVWSKPHHVAFTKLPACTVGLCILLSLQTSTHVKTSKLLHNSEHTSSVSQVTLSCIEWSDKEVSEPDFRHIATVPVCKFVPCKHFPCYIPKNSSNAHHNTRWTIKVKHGRNKTQSYCNALQQISSLGEQNRNVSNAQLMCQTHNRASARLWLWKNSTNKQHLATIWRNTTSKCLPVPGQ